MSKRKFIGERRIDKPTNSPQVRQLFDDQLPLNKALEIFVHAKEAQGLRQRTLEEYKKHCEYLSEFLVKVWVRDSNT